MGAGFSRIAAIIDCKGQSVTAKLDQVFKNPGTAKYNYAQTNNTFGTVPNAQNNWKDLIIAYVVAGVDIGDEGHAWVFYLQQLDPQYIYNIAQARFTALQTNAGVTTTTHDPNKGGHAPIITAGSIDSPCPP
jgi:hypothetical protein